jgi:L1 cell adhesion molecule like protein
LKKLKETAEYFLSKSVDGCVISIPAHFEQVQKEALLKAAHEAGFAYAYSLHEPVAAVMAFNSTKNTEEKPDKQIVVLDLGAEAFNVSVISSHDGLYTIEESIEESNLGGRNFDRVLADLVKEEFKRKTKMDISDNKRAIQKLLNAAEKTKRSLTKQDTAPCYIESLYDGMDFNGMIMRGRFEMLAESLYVRCKDTVKKALKKAGITAQQVDQVLLIGGSSKMPRFQSEMKSLFPDIGEGFRADVESDEAIALGCAVQAGILLEEGTDFDENATDAEHLSKAVGILDKNNAFIPVFPVGTPIPVRRQFSIPLAPKQTSVHLVIAEQGAEKASSVAEVALRDIPSSVVDGQVEVVIIIEADLAMSVTMTELKSSTKVHTFMK